MAGHSKIMEYIAKCDDAHKLEILIKNARKQGGGEKVEEAAFRKLVSLVPGVKPGFLKHEFWTMVHAFEHLLSEENGKPLDLAVPGRRWHEMA
jgi:hypothetical protein